MYLSLFMMENAAWKEKTGMLEYKQEACKSNLDFNL